MAILPTALLLMQAVVGVDDIEGQGVASPLPEVAAAAPAANEIIVRARNGEHPARLGPVLPERRDEGLPRARLNLGDGVSISSEVSTHPREGVGEMHLRLHIPF